MIKFMLYLLLFEWLPFLKEVLLLSRRRVDVAGHYTFVDRGTGFDGHPIAAVVRAFLKAADGRMAVSLGEGFMQQWGVKVFKAYVAASRVCGGLDVRHFDETGKLLAE